MTEVIPFRGILYNTAKVSGGDVVAPPYDIITPEMRDQLYGRSPYNIVKIDAGKDEPGDNERGNKYQRAAALLMQWTRESVLLASPAPSFYAYEMDYPTPEGRRRLSGFFGLVKIVEMGEGVYPHEETHAKPKVDRLNLMKACQANTSPIFSLYHSSARRASGVVKKVIQEKPYMEAEDLSGSVHRFWPISGKQDIQTISDDLSGKAIFIADGHHRYETALEYRKIIQAEAGPGTGSEPFCYVLMFLANIADGDITILPTHRIVRCGQEDILTKLSGHFDIAAVADGTDMIEAIRGKPRTFGFCRRGDSRRYLIRHHGSELKTVPSALQELDVTILHELILKSLLHASAVAYEMDPSRAQQIMSSEGYDAVFFLNPTMVEDVERVALSALRMPPKSTYFFPKVMTGFVINSLRNPD